MVILSKHTIFCASEFQQSIMFAWWYIFHTHHLSQFKKLAACAGQMTVFNSLNMMRKCRFLCHSGTRIKVMFWFQPSEEVCIIITYCSKYCFLFFVVDAKEVITKDAEVQFDYFFPIITSSTTKKSQRQAINYSK